VIIVIKLRPEIMKAMAHHKILIVIHLISMIMILMDLMEKMMMIKFVIE